MKRRRVERWLVGEVEDVGASWPGDGRGGVASAGRVEDYAYGVIVVAKNGDCGAGPLDDATERGSAGKREEDGCGEKSGSL